MMMHHPLLLASRPMGTMQQQRQPLFLTVRSIGATPPPASPTALGLPADGSNLPEEGDATVSGFIGNEVGPASDGATATPNIPPVRLRQSTLFPIFRRGNAQIGQSPATTAIGRGGLGTTAQAARPPAARNASESEDTAAPTIARASTSASAGARGTAPGQPPAALPAATSPDADAQQSGPTTMAACLGTGALAGEMRMTPRASPPPAALAAPRAITVRDALGIETAGGDVERVTQRTPTSLPSRAVDETTQTAAAAPATRVGATVCADGCAGGTCGEMHVWTFVPAAILVATPLAVANPYILVATPPAVANSYLNATTSTVADAGGGEAAH